MLNLRQKGFTLIEIIAVLVLLGILAAVAVPRFLSLQNDAAEKAAQAAVAAVHSGLSQSYAKVVLQGDDPADFGIGSTCTVNGEAVYVIDGTITVECSEGELSSGTTITATHVGHGVNATGDWLSPEL